MDMQGLSKLKNRIAKKMLFHWVEKDFAINMDLLEEYKLRRHIQNNLSDVSEESDFMPNIVDYIAAFVISMYSEYDNIPEPLNTIDEEADFVVREFIAAYKTAIKEKEYDLLKYFAIPEIEITENEKELFKEKAHDFQSNEGQLFNLEDKDFKQLLDKVFELAGKNYRGRSKKFWKPGLKHYAVAIWCVIYQCVRDVSSFSQEYQINYVEDGEQRCLFNFFNLYIHGILFTGKLLLPIEDRRIMFAASALHPAQDDYIDNNEVSKEILDDIHRKLLGQDVQCRDPKAKSVFDLVDVIYNRYKPEEHPKLVEIFIKLHEWQCKSMFQKSKKLKEEELLEISFMKGGYAFAFYGYIALGEMNAMQFRHFFGMGAIFQIMDDLHDIEIDIENEVETIWTKRINENLDTDEAMYGIIGTQRKFESITNEIPSLRKPVCIRRMELFAVRLDLGKFYLSNRKYFSNDLICNIQHRFGFDAEPYIDGYKLKLDQLKSMDDFKTVLLSLKDSYTKEFMGRSC